MTNRFGKPRNVVLGVNPPPSNSLFSSRADCLLPFDWGFLLSEVFNLRRTGCWRVLDGQVVGISVGQTETTIAKEECEGNAGKRETLESLQNRVHRPVL